MQENTVPKNGITSKAKVKRVIDGDTLEIEINKVARIRLLDCNAPEIRGAQKEFGEEAKIYCQKMVDIADEIRIHIPTDDDGHIQDILTLNRILGEIWLKIDQKWYNLAKLMMDAGHATPTK